MIPAIHQDPTLPWWLYFVKPSPQYTPESAPLNPPGTYHNLAKVLQAPWWHSHTSSNSVRCLILCHMPKAGCLIFLWFCVTLMLADAVKPVIWLVPINRAHCETWLGKWGIRKHQIQQESSLSLKQMTIIIFWCWSIISYPLIILNPLSLNLSLLKIKQGHSKEFFALKDRMNSREAFETKILFHNESWKLERFSNHTLKA